MTIAAPRRQRARLITSALVAVTTIATLAACSDDKGSSEASSATTTPAATSSASTAPGSSTTAPGSSTTAPVPAGSVSCDYQQAEQAARPVKAPAPNAPTTGTTEVELKTSAGEIGLDLDRAKSPCTVNSFVSLVQQGYFDNTKCHRLTASAGLKVLQCGDPTGTGTGGPGYQFADEYPATAPDAGNGLYKRGVLAMANAGPGTNGSQFFLVYGNSQLPPAYTIFGTIDEDGLATLDKVAAAGLTPGAMGPDDGTPKLGVTITSAKLD